MIGLLSPVSSHREDVIYYLKKWIFIHFAEAYGFTKLLLGCSALSVAKKTMAEIGKGRGLSLPHEIAFIDDRYRNDLKFMNPMREFLWKEIAVFNYIN